MLYTCMKQVLPIIACLLFAFSAFAQPAERKEKITLDGEIVTALITDNDTIIVADLEDIYVSSLRSFENKDDYRRYLKYRRYGAKVYHYAVDAIRIFKEVEYVTNNMKPSKRKKHIRRLNREYKKEFKDQLKNLTKTQGFLLIKMIEKELDVPMYTLIKNLRGGVTASYWHELGKFNGYNLKSGYNFGEDKILDAVLQDFDVSYEVDLEELELKTDY